DNANVSVFPIAVVGPLTPSSKAFGIPHLQSITLATDEYNKEHDGQKRRVQLQVFDDQANSDLSQTIVSTVSSSNTVAILGPANSSASAAVIQLMQNRKIGIPVISSLSTATKLTDNLETRFFFRANVSDRKRLSTFLEYVFSDDKLKPRRAVLFYEKAD